MKRKKLKVFSLISVITLSTVLALSIDKKEVKADSEGECTTYTNYYLFVEANSKSKTDEVKTGNCPNGLSNCIDGKWTLNRTKSFTMNIPSNATNPDGSALTLNSGKSYYFKADGNAYYKEGDTEKKESSLNISSLKSFYEKYANSNSTGKKDNNNYYFSNSKWEDEQGNDVNKSVIWDSVDDAVKASIFPTTVLSMTNIGGTGSHNFSVQRVYDSATGNVGDSNTGICVKYSSTSDACTTGINGNGWTAYLAPTMYVLPYKVCPTSNNSGSGENSTAHTLTIHYWYDEVGGTVAANDYSNTYTNGQTYEVKSPSIANWEADTKVVSGTMGNEDIVVNVIYKGKYGEVSTGLIWLLGVAGLGYGAYYFSKSEKDNKKTNKEK